MADYCLSDVNFQMAAFQLSRQNRHANSFTPKRWSGRIEKPRSHQSSPALDIRRRAYSTARQTSSGHFNSLNAQFQAPQQATRPLSWGPTTATNIRAPTMEYLASPAALSYTATPAYSSYTSTPYQYPTVQPLYRHGSKFATSPATTASVTSAASYYSNDSYSPSSTAGSCLHMPSHQAVHQDCESSYASPEYSSYWRYPPLAQAPARHTYQNVTAPVIISPEKLWQQDDDLDFKCRGRYLVDRPSSPDLLWSGRTTDDDGEVLVAMGLYDLPDENASLSDVPPKLKLAETWQPTPIPAMEEDVDSADETDMDKIEFVKPAAGTSWFR